MEGTFFAPGRVNLIGEHIDYNGGYVLPFAISCGTYLSIIPNETNMHRFYSENFKTDEYIYVDVDNIVPSTHTSWINYPLGIIAEFSKKGIQIPACDFAYKGDIPIGSGLSSSASIEVVTAYALNDIFNYQINLKELVLMSKSCENNFVGLNCGIMDQFIVGFGKENHALLLNCDTLDYKYVNFVLDDMSVVVVNTNKVRKLSDSKYNERFAQCLKIKDIISKVRKIDYLCELKVDEIEEYRQLIDDEILFKRLRHVLSENDRVFKTVDALNKNDFKRVGELLFMSHESLKQDYEVTGKELDAIVEYAVDIDGVLGARMTGAGFGGCAIALVKNYCVEHFKETIAKQYTRKTGLRASFYVVECSDGAKKI